MLDFAIIKLYYLAGVWSSKMVATAVQKGVISVEQYQEITGKMYKA